MRGQSRNVSAGPRQTGGESISDGVVVERQDDGDGRSRLFGVAIDRRSSCDNDIDVKAHELRRKSGQALGLPLRVAPLNLNVSPFCVATVAQRLTEGVGAIRD